MCNDPPSPAGGKIFHGLVFLCLTQIILHFSAPIILNYMLFPDYTISSHGKKGSLIPKVPVQTLPLLCHFLQFPLPCEYLLCVLCIQFHGGSHLYVLKSLGTGVVSFYLSILRTLYRAWHIIGGQYVAVS